MNDNSSTPSPIKSALIYLGIGIVIYGVIYYFTFYKKPLTSDLDIETESEAESLVELPEVEAEVELTANGFSPEEVTISAGTMVRWLNNSGKTASINSDDHPTHKNYPFLNLGEFEDGNSMSLVFEEPGTYHYHNHLNEIQTGVITVE